jgi:hypothetical protein
METSNQAFGKILFIVLVCFIANTLHAQPDKSTVKTIVDSKHFTFHAQTALPSSGRTRQLTTEYDLRIFEDSLVSNLPFMEGHTLYPMAQATEDFILLRQNLNTQLLPARRKDGI